MRRCWVFAVAGLPFLGMLSPPAFAAEAPKVAIHGVLDSVTAWAQNLGDLDQTTDEKFWYSRHRGQFNIIAQVGKAKAVYGFELDFVNGKNFRSIPGPLALGFLDCGFDLGIDEAPIDETKFARGCIEVTTLYVEFPATGPGSLVPQIPMPTTARWGGQRFSGHEYKIGILAQDRFGGVNLVTGLAPNAKNTFTFVQIEEEWTGEGAFIDATESFAILDSVEYTPQKGLTIKPTFAYDFRDRPNANTRRLTFGADARWRQGPYMVEPTFLYQFGDRQSTAAPGGEVDINAWIFDVIGTWRSGPWTLGGRISYTPGNDATDQPGTVDDIESYTVVFNPGTYYFGWSELWTTGIEYLQQIAPDGAALGNTIGFVPRITALGPKPNAGLLAFAVKAEYALTPALTVRGLLHPRWSAEDVDTNDDNSGPGGTDLGDENFLGTEIVFGFTWRFAPNLRFDARYAHLFAGDALNRPDGAGGTIAEDVDSLAARVRFTF